MARILIVDDDPISVSTLEYCLRGEEHHLQSVPTGEEALRVISQQAFDLVILDVALPEMDGLETLRRIRNFNADLSVMMLTGYGNVADAAKALGLGADDYVLKPIEPDSFVYRVDTTLKKSRFLEEKLSEKEIQSNIRLAAGLCHHLNNMLCVITGRSSMMLEDPEMSPNLREECEEIARVAGDMSSLMQRLSSISRADTPTEPDVVPMQELDAVVKEFDKQHKVHIVVNTHMDAYNLALECSRPRIQQLYRELLQNAIEATPEGSELHIDTSVEGLANAQCFNLIIRDQGSGIDPQHFDMIFQPFFSTRQTLGLGLPVALSICAQLGGRLSVQNASVGKGVEAKLSIPVKSLAFDAPPVKSTIAASSAIQKIMVIDDEKPIITLASRMLSRLGFEVKTEMDGQAAIQNAAEICEWADLVILDIMLGAVNGVDVHQQLRRHDKDIPVVFVSGFSVNSMVDDLLKKDVHTRFIAKPFDVSDLKDAISSVGAFPTAG